MSKVIPIQCGKSLSVNDALEDAKEHNFTEIVILGREKDGSYWFRGSPFECCYTQVGVLEAAKQWLIEGADE